MEIVLGVSMTPTTVRMVLVEGEKADGVTVDHDVFDVRAADGSATSPAAEQVVAAVLGTQESAAAGGHHLKSVGVTWSDHTEATHLRDTLTARGVEGVMLVSEGHAAAALAQAVGRAVGYDTTALFFIDRDTATLSVVQTDDGSVVKVLSRTLHDGDAMAVLADMAAAVDAQDARPQGMFVVGAGIDISSVKAHLEHLVSLPVNAPEEPELALARGAALASANAPALEATTVGLAYSQDPDDGTTAGSAYAGLAGAVTQMAPNTPGAGSSGLFGVVGEEPEALTEERPVDEGRKPFLLVGSALTSIFVVGVVALVISLAVSIRPTVDQRPSPGQNAIVPSSQAPAPPAVPEAKPVDPPPAPPAETIKAPVPVVQQAPQAPPAPRTVYVEQPAAPAPQAPAPAPAAPPPPAPAAPPAPAPVIPPPVYRPPVFLPPPVVVLPPILRPPVADPPARPPWRPPWTPPWERSDDYDDDSPQAPQLPSPQIPQVPQSPPPVQVPATPVWPPSGPGGFGGPGSGQGGPGSGQGGPGSGQGPGRSGGSDDSGPGGSSGGDGGGSSGRGGSGGSGGSPVWPWPFGGGGGGHN
ncbi:MAG: hypothetical protein JST91_28565 [Actinobacteria bacterium]|nr:hypothetical protein [Actinomycetota bacterium]